MDAPAVRASWALRRARRRAVPPPQRRKDTVVILERAGHVTEVVLLCRYERRLNVDEGCHVSLWRSISGRGCCRTVCPQTPMGVGGQVVAGGGRDTRPVHT